MADIMVGFIYLSLVNIRKEPSEGKTALIEERHRILHARCRLATLRLFAGLNALLIRFMGVFYLSLYARSDSGETSVFATSIRDPGGAVV